VSSVYPPDEEGERGPVRRGCGYREEGLYAVCETSPFGKDISYFLIDPVVPWKGPHLRAPMLEPNRHGVNHIIMGVGVKYYPFVCDWVEETARLGMSKRIPRKFDVTKLTPGRTKIILFHPRAIPDFEYDCDHECPKGLEDEHECIGALWPLSALESHRRLHRVEPCSGELEGVKVHIHTPSVHYLVNVPRRPTDGKGLPYRAGLFIQLPITRFEYVSKTGRVPRGVERGVREAGYDLEVCKW